MKLGLRVVFGVEADVVAGEIAAPNTRAAFRGESSPGTAAFQREKVTERVGRLRPRLRENIETAVLLCCATHSTSSQFR